MSSRDVPPSSETLLHTSSSDSRVVKQNMLAGTYSYRHTLCNNPEERRPSLHCDGLLKSHNSGSNLRNSMTSHSQKTTVLISPSYPHIC